MSRAFHNGSSVVGSNIFSTLIFGYCSSLPNFIDSNILINYNAISITDSSGNIYYIGYNSSLAGNQIFKYNIFTKINTPYTGYTSPSLSSGSSSDGTTLGNITLPTSTSQLVIDPSGNIYFSEYPPSKIRKINTSGVLSTLVASGLNFNSGYMCCDSSGNVYVTTSTKVRKINALSNTVTTFAGTNSSGSSGDGGLAISAKLNSPKCVVFDSSGNLYISDYANNKIRKVDKSTGIITTVTGASSLNFSGIGNLQPVATFTTYTSDLSGNSYIFDSTFNNMFKFNYTF
jgi:hypothetical protein